MRTLSLPSRAVAIALLAATLLSCGERETFEPPEGPGPWILVDLYHTRIQNPEDYRLAKGNYNYQGTFGYARAFDHLEANGYQWNSIREIELSKPRLEGYDVLFINLVHEERPDFTDDEVEAIKDFVAGGGGLVVIADHTNVYYHAERVNRFLKDMGIEVTYHSALEPGDRSISGLGWIAIDDMANHPINDGVEMISFQTGGTQRALDERATVTSRTSPEGFGDLWDESTGRGFYGNWAFDGDIAAEPRGRVPVVTTAEYGEGRVAVIGDQNIYGDAWLHFGDNFKHLMNVFEWAAQREGTQVTPLRDTRPAGYNIGVDIHFNRWAPGNGGPDSYYTWYVNFNRDQEVTAKGILRLENTEDALIMPSPTRDFAQEDLDAIVDYLEDGKKVVLTFEIDDLMDTRFRPTVELVRQLAPDFNVGLNGQTINFNEDASRIAGKIRAAGVPAREGEFELESELMSVDGLKVGSWQTIGDGERQPYLIEVTSTWGESLLRTKNGFDIARRRHVGDGELIIVLQDGFWRNRTTGGSESEPPPEGGDRATELQYRFIDYLKKPLGVCEKLCADLPEPDLTNGPSGPGPWVLVDLYHTRKQNPEDYRLVKGLYRYQGTHGWARAFDHLESNGYNWSSVRDEPLSEDVLEGYDILFINLVHDDRPDFTDEEVELIKDFVYEGGGLFVVADHTNVYYHAERINRFLKDMGIEVTYHTAIDYGDAQVSGLGWIAIENLTEHPINEGVEMISFQTGGLQKAIADNATPTAKLSEQGLGDFWDESSGLGFYGNWSFDGDEEVEPRGPSTVGIVSEYGQGRVAVIGDQNMFGDVWLHFGDNFRNWLNIIEWLAQRDGSDAPLGETRSLGTHIGVDVHFSRYSPGNAGTDNYYTFYVNLNRDQEVTAKAIKRLENTEDVLIMPTPRRPFEQRDLEAIKDYLDAGKRVVVMFELDRVAGQQSTQATLDLVRFLAPDLTLEDTDGQMISFDQETEALAEAINAANFDRRVELPQLASEDMVVDDLQVASYTTLQDNATPYIIDVHTDWGEPLLQTAGGIDIARKKRVGDGELIIFLQDGFWRVRTIGKTEIQPPPAHGESAVELEYRFIDYLKTPIE